MRGIGTIINAAAILAGGILGIIFGKKVGDKIRETLITVCGVCTITLAICGAVQEMVFVDDKILSGRGNTAMAIICLALGGLIGELLDIDGKFEGFGEWLKVKSGSQKDNSFVQGFVNTSLTVCIGAMAIVGSIQDGILGDYSILVAKSMLDLIIVMVMAASLGKGCVFSAIPVAILQGGVTALSGIIEPLMTPTALSNLSLTGNIMILCVGLNLIRDKKIRVANLLPGLILAVAWALVLD